MFDHTIGKYNLHKIMDLTPKIVGFKYERSYLKKDG